MTHHLESELSRGADALHLELGELQMQQLLQYLDLIQKWSRVYNLTALREPGEIVTHHLLDSLAVVPPLLDRLKLEAAPARKQSILDVGSGAGLPGTVIAIAAPQLQVDCVDTVAKKAAFIQQVAVTLKLPNLRGIHARVERFVGQYDVVTSRAFASLNDFVRLSRTVLAPEGHWIALKGKYPDEEIASLPSDVEVFHVEQLHVPGLDAERCLVWMKRKSSLT